LLQVANRDGVTPAERNVAYPINIHSLMVSGTEILPDGTPNLWNKRHSIALLRFYGEDDATDNEEEASTSSRNRRLRVARMIGVTNTQINMALLTM
jgi:hypothetical protein